MATASGTPGQTALDPSGITTMIGKHKDLQHTISGYITQAQTTVDGIESQNSGSMVTAVQNVFDTWKSSINDVQNDLSSMITDLQNSLNSLTSHDENNAHSIGRTSGN